MIRFFSFLLLAIIVISISGCKELSYVIPDEEGKALGAACAQKNISLESCYQKYPEKNPAYVYAGWIDMLEYMKKHNLTAIKPEELEDQSIQH